MAVETTLFDTIKRFKRLRGQLPTLIGNEAVNHFKENFRKGGFQDGGRVQHWKKRRDDPSRNKGRGVLIQSGRLKRSIRIVRKGRNVVTIGTDVPYARIHNEGGNIRKTVNVRSHSRRSSRTGRKGGAGRITVKAHTRKMNTTIPKRKFIGDSTDLDRRIKRMIRYRLLKVFR